MTDRLPASLPPGCTATTASAHYPPLAFSSLSSSSSVCPLSCPPQVPASAYIPAVSAVAFPSQTFQPASHLHLHPPPSDFTPPQLFPFPQAHYSQLGLSTHSSGFVPSPVSVVSPITTPISPFHHHSFESAGIDSTPSLTPLPTPPDNPLCLPFDTHSYQMSQSSHAAAMAAAAAAPSPSMRILSESNPNVLKMPPNPHLAMFATDSPAKPPLPSSLIASSSAGPVPHPSAPVSSSASYAAAAAAATAAASASTLPPRMPSLGGPLFGAFSSAAQLDKENSMQNGNRRLSSSFAIDPLYRTPEGVSHFQTPPQSQMAHSLHTPGPKRLLDAAPLRERPAKRTRTDDSHVSTDSDKYVDLPSPSNMPHIEDDGRKPPFSYATLIGMAILRSPNRRLTLAQIYKWITDHFLHYRNAESGWQNSIRHNLSLNKAFQKVERPKDDPGKGHYWVIQSGMEHQFLKDRPARRTTVSDHSGPPNPNFAVKVPSGMPTPQASFMATPQSLPPRNSGIDYSHSSRPPTSGSMTQGVMQHPSHHHHLGHGSPSVVASLRGESFNLSPPASTRDPSHVSAMLSMQAHPHGTDINHSRADSAQSSHHNMRSSPPPANSIFPRADHMNSSPNTNGMNTVSSGDNTRPSSQSGGMPSSILRPSMQPDHDTPPPVPPFSSLGHLTGDHSVQKGKHGYGGSFADSGYWSSIDSSIRRPTHAGSIAPNETDLGFDRGRAVGGGYGAITRLRGRAEEELARLRGTGADADSPSMARAGSGRWPAASILSSPPIRHENDPERTCAGDDLDMKRKGGARKMAKPQTSMIDTSCKTPLTPPVMFKRPIQEPPSASPNTNLKNHRESIRQLLGSPDVNLGGIMGDMHNYYDGGFGSSPLKGISPIKFSTDDWTTLRTPVPNSQRGNRLRHDDEPAPYNSSPVRNYSDHHEVYLNLVNTPKVYTPDSADSSKTNRLLPPPKADLSSHMSPGKAFPFPPPMKSPLSTRMPASHPFLSAPKLGLPRMEINEFIHHDEASPTKASLPWPSTVGQSANSRVVSAPLSFPSLKKPRLGRSPILDEAGPSRAGIESTGRALAEVLGVDNDGPTAAEIPTTRPQSTSLESETKAPAAPVSREGSSSPRGFDLMKGFMRIGSQTMVNPTGSPTKLDRSRSGSTAF